MEPCIQSANVTSPCLTCGGRAKKLHRPLFHRGTFCPRCCPVCAQKMSLATGIGTAWSTDVARESPARMTGKAATQWRDAGWGPRPADPSYHDRERHTPRSRVDAAAALVQLERTVWSTWSCG